VEERFGSVGLRREGLRERQLHREASREGGTLLRAANRGWWLITFSYRARPGGARQAQLASCL
jgi:hypothetical protein